MFEANYLEPKRAKEILTRMTVSEAERHRQEQAAKVADALTKATKIIGRDAHAMWWDDFGEIPVPVEQTEEDQWQRFEELCA
jgi:hypothetical protein